MKKVFTMLIGVNDVTLMERTLNNFRIGLNDWDKTRVLTIDDTQVVNYTIICDEETFTSIVNVLNGTRVY